MPTLRPVTEEDAQTLSDLREALQSAIAYWNNFHDDLLLDSNNHTSKKEEEKKQPQKLISAAENPVVVLSSSLSCIDILQRRIDHLEHETREMEQKLQKRTNDTSVLEQMVIDYQTELTQVQCHLREAEDFGAKLTIGLAILFSIILTIYAVPTFRFFVGLVL